MEAAERRPELVDLKLPTIALIGRVNVGKSTLFNNLLEKHAAIVSPVPGTTRTRNIGHFTWRGTNARVIDAGGLTFHKDDIFSDEIVAQTKRAIDEADVILFLVDIEQGLMPQEREIARLLHKTKKPVMLIANKADAPRQRSGVYNSEWLKLGLGTPFAISAVNGVGVGDLLDDIFKKFRSLGRRPKQIKIKPSIRVAIVGKPNVGKSTLLNQILGDDYVISSPEPHTTRETFSTLVKWNDDYIEFIDTAGIRRKSKVEAGLEKAGVSQSIRHLQEADVILLMVDATDPASAQEKLLAQFIASKRRSVVFVINKWDLIEDHSEDNRKKFIAALDAYYPHLTFAASIFISAQTGYRVHDLYDLIKETFTARHIKVGAQEMDVFLRKILARHPPTRGRGTNHPKIFGLKQLGSDPPEFQITVKARTSLNISYIRFIERLLREEFGFIGTPIILYTKKTKR